MRPADPFLNELFLHLFRRDHYYSVSWKFRETDPARFADHLTIAMRENQILEKYFPHALDAAGGRWGADKQEQCAEFADYAAPYVSEVSDHLVTAATEAQLWWILLGLAGLVGWGYVRYGREPFPGQREESSLD